MIYCPLMTIGRGVQAQTPCMKMECRFADEVGDCLVKQALQCYVAKERTRVASEIEAESRRTKAM